jgi:shikimate kinase
VLKQKFPLIGEVVGLAGSGKTTLAHALNQRDARVQIVPDFELRNPSQWPIFASQLPFLMTHICTHSRAERRFTWDELKALIYLNTWPALLQRQQTRGDGAILLNHGPLFKLATLAAFGPASLWSSNFASWWRQQFEQWAATLDLVIWLTAPDPTLIERINTRTQRHAIKGKSTGEAQLFLTRYQHGYEQVLAKLMAHGGPTLLHFDSSQRSVEQIADEVVGTFFGKAPYACLYSHQ